MEVDQTGNLVPELAESWEPGDSPSTWIFNLRKDVTFRDGKTVDADDVITTVRYHGGEGSKSGYRSMVKAIADMEADGKNRVIVHLKAPNAHFPFLMAAFEILSTKDGVPYDFANGTGPYNLKEFEPGVRATLERHPSHWREGVGWFDSITLLAILDVAARQNALVTGEVDVISEPDRRTWQLLNRREGIKVDVVKSSVHRTWPMHTDKPPYDNNDVRLALKYAVDREKLVKTVLNGTGSVGNDHPISPVNKFFNKELPQRVYDPDKAKFHLKKAGMENLTVKLSSSEAIWDGAIDAAAVYSESAAKAGIKIEINRVPSDGYWSDVWLKHPWSASLWSGRADRGLDVHRSLCCRRALERNHVEESQVQRIAEGGQGRARREQGPRHVLGDAADRPRRWRRCNSDVRRPPARVYGQTGARNHCRQLGSRRPAPA